MESMLAAAAPREIDYASVVAIAADWTTVTGEDGRYLYVSSACHRLIGWAKSELEGSSADDFVHPDDCGATTGRKALREATRSR